MMLKHSFFFKNIQILMKKRVRIDQGWKHVKPGINELFFHSKPQNILLNQPKKLKKVLRQSFFSNNFMGFWKFFVLEKFTSAKWENFIWEKFNWNK